MYTRILNKKIHFKKFGSGEPILFLHGWGGNMYDLHKLATLASNKFTSYLIDLPGFGKSDNPTKHWGVEGYAIVIREFIQHEKLQKPHVMGHAFGSKIALYLASSYPTTINKLICCNSSFKRGMKVSRSAKLMKRIPRHHWFIQPMYPYVKYLYYRLFQKNSDLLNHPHLETNFRKIISHDLTSQLKKISNPTLILWGENDSCTPVIWAYEMEKKIKKSQLYVFPEQHHNLPLKQPKLIWDQMKEFLLT